MNFYQSLQLDPFVLKQQMKNATSSKEKHFFIKALVVRDILLVAFAIFFVSVITTFFGEDTSSLAVVLFCILLSIRFVDFGYHITHSLISLAVVFAVLFISPVLNQIVSPIPGFFINFISLLILFFLTSSNPQMGNASLYSFSYIFLTGTSNAKDIYNLSNKGLLLVLCYILFAVIFFIKHKNKNENHSFMQEMIGEDFFSKRNLWLIYVALGVSMLFFIGEYSSLNRFMWVGFACSSLLSNYNTHDIKQRFYDRLIGVVLGSVLFSVVLQLTPPSATFILGPMGGLALGLCSSYRYKSLFNCFGALALASGIYGIHDAVIFRILNNLIGLIFGYVYYIISIKIFSLLKTKHAHN